MMNPDPFKYFKTSPEIIRLAVMLYIRFPLLLRDVALLLFGLLSMTQAQAAALQVVFR